MPKRIPNTMVPLLAVLAAACGTALPAAHALAQAGPRVGQRAELNAALDYWRIMEILGNDAELADAVREAADRLSRQDEDGVSVAVDIPGELRPGGATARLLVERSSSVAGLIRASSVPSCDFQIRYEDGFDALLPHLRSMRQSAWLLIVDARRVAAAGDLSGAAERLAATLRMARHVASDFTMISSLVAVSMAHSACVQAAWLLEQPGLADAQREALHAAALGFDPEDPFNLVGALTIEQDMVGLLATKYRGPDAGRRFAEGFIGDNWEGLEAEERAVAAMDGPRFREAIDRTVDAYDLLIDAWLAEDAEERLAAWGARLEAGDFGPIAILTVPSYGQVRTQAAKGHASLLRIRDTTAPDR
ncbi:MAG: hypothetical protein AAFX79_00390 [Planctomycetota bacterium]